MAAVSHRSDVQYRSHSSILVKPCLEIFAFTAGLNQRDFVQGQRRNMCSAVSSSRLHRERDMRLLEGGGGLGRVRRIFLLSNSGVTTLN
ncbi:hypothetical protein BT93_E1899 [Corymbia citriodora subsp. variegata]|nr:hypothetical protein BT93_E1899 [Corymbia citriodora subsp. variegata]